ncbi:hypothetical protein J2789_004492 [Variovorax paradoxus]|uniref:hypothetical protein n=1 Tax=Variovorax atrisoli TaxID=3394203 RepID=UPI00119C0D07|nr:hypothetical protein [Variovorax paradoxus]MDR6521802.1 hypothetical protein [Variovorax paradoxus]
MTNASVQTSAPAVDRDMFVDAAHGSQAFDGAIYELHGTMAAAAEVRVKMARDGLTALPVLCMEVRPIHGGHGRTLHAEQTYPEDGREAAEAKAATLKKGTPITLLTSLKDMRTILPHVQAVEPSLPA